MEIDNQVSACQAVCDHSKFKWYTQRQFDMLNGFELILTRCINCHKTMALEVKKLD